MPPEARVGIRYELEGLEDLEAQLQSFTQRLSQAWAPFSAISVGGPLAMGSGVPQEMRGGNGQMSFGQIEPSFQGFSPSPGAYASPMQGGGFGMVSQIVISQVNTIIIQSAGTVQMGGGSFVGGGAPGGGGDFHYYPPGEAGGTGGLPSPGSAAAGDDDWFRPTGIPGANRGGGMLRHIGAAVGFAGAYALGHMGSGLIDPIARMEPVTPESLGTSIFGPMASLPVVGALFQPIVSRLQALNDLHTFEMGAAVRGGSHGAEWQQVVEHGGYANITPGEAGRMASQIESLAPGVAANPEAMRAALRSLDAFKDPRMRAAALGQRGDLLERVLSNPFSAMGWSGRVAGGGSPWANRQEGELAVAYSAMTGDWMGVERLRGEGQGLGIDMGYYARQGHAVAGGELNIQYTGLQYEHSQIAEQMASATYQGGQATASAIAGEGAPLAASLSEVDSQIDRLRKVRNKPGGSELEKRQADILIAQLENRRAGLQVAQSSLPFRRIEATYSAGSRYGQASYGMGQTQLGLVEQFGWMPDSRAFGEAFGQMGAGIDRQLQAEESRLASLRAQPGVGPEILREAEARVASLRAQRRTLPLQREQAAFGAYSAVNQAAIGSAQSALSFRSMVTMDPGEITSLSDDLVSAMRQQVENIRQHIQRLRAQGAGDAQIKPLEQALQALQNDASAQALQAARQSASLGRAPHETALSIAGSTLSAMGALGELGGSGMLTAQGAEGASLNSLVQNLEAEKARIMRQPVIDWQRLNQIDAELARLRAQQAQQPAQWIGQFYGGYSRQAAAIGGTAAEQISFSQGMGYTVSPELQGAFATRLGASQEQANIAWQSYQATARAYGVNSTLAQEARHGAVAAQYQYQQQRVGALGEWYGMQQGESQGVSNLYGSWAGLQLQRGAGSMQVMGARDMQVEEADRQVALKRWEVEQLRSTPGVSAQMIREKEGELMGLRQQSNQARSLRMQYQPSAELQERASQAQFAVQVLSQTPGSYGNIRAALNESLAVDRERYGDLNGLRERAMRDPNTTPEQMHELNERIREVQGRALGTFNQLSYGWESRLMSTMLGTPGSFNIQARGFALRDAVVGGHAVNPHMGATGGQLPWFMRYAQNVGMPVFPGLRGGFPGGSTGIFGFGGLGTGGVGAVNVGAIPQMGWRPPMMPYDWQAHGAGIPHAGAMPGGVGGIPVRVHIDPILIKVVGVNGQALGQAVVNPENWKQGSERKGQR